MVIPRWTSPLASRAHRDGRVSVVQKEGGETPNNYKEGRKVTALVTFLIFLSFLFVAMKPSNWCVFMHKRFSPKTLRWLRFLKVQSLFLNNINVFVCQDKKNPDGLDYFSPPLSPQSYTLCFTTSTKRRLTGERSKMARVILRLENNHLAQPWGYLTR